MSKQVFPGLFQKVIGWMLPLLAALSLTPGTAFSAPQSNRQASAPPVIASITPNPITRSDSPQELVISGSNFLPGSDVRLRLSANGGVQTYTKPARYVSDSQITLQASFPDPGTVWEVQVVNPEGRLSSAITLPVVLPQGSPTGASAAPAQAPAAARSSYVPRQLYYTGAYPVVGPVITRIVPGSVARPNRSQRLTIFGSNFAPGATVTLRNLTQGRTYSALPTNYISPFWITLQANLAGIEDLWTAQVNNPGGTPSQQFSFQVVVSSGEQPFVPLSPARQELYPPAR